MPIGIARPRRCINQPSSGWFRAVGHQLAAHLFRSAESHIVMPMESPGDSFASVLAAAARNRMALARQQIAQLPRAGAAISNGDAIQLVMSLYQVLIEELEGHGKEQRTAFMEDVIPSAIAAGIPLDVAVKGISRSYLVFCGDVIPDLPSDVRGSAALWFAEYASTLLVEVVNAFEKAHVHR